VCVCGVCECVCVCVCVCVWCVDVSVCVFVCVCFFYMRDPSNFSTDKSQMILDRAKEEDKKDD